MPHKTAFLTFEPQSLFLSSLSKLSLPRELLSTIPLLLPQRMSPLTLSQGSPLPRLIQGNRVNLMTLTLGAVRVDFFRHIHRNHRPVRYKTAPLITIYTFLGRKQDHTKKVNMRAPNPQIFCINSVRPPSTSRSHQAASTLNKVYSPPKYRVFDKY